MSVKEYLKKKKEQKTPDEIMLGMFEMAKEQAEKIAKATVEKEVNKFSDDLKELRAILKVEKGSRNFDVGLKGISQIKGDKGDNPTDEELLELINPLIPVVEDGHTPTKEEILAIIKPLIPEVKDGATPTKEELLALILPNIPVIKQPKDGSPDKPEDISKKLNTLEEKVEMKVIKGLKDYLKKLETNLFYKGSGKSGGGMSNLVPETFEVGSSTTSVTLQYEVASNGTAIWMYYQGQHLAQNVHYTVSGKVVTLDFTLTDNTYIDVKYHRK